MQIWKVKFGHNAKFLSTRFQGLVKILKSRQDVKLEFGQFFSADVL